MPLAIYHYLLIFFAYSFLGWLVEVVYWFLSERRLHNPGFIGGPFCPIYGLGSLLVILFLRPLESNPFLVFILGTVIVTIVEYVTHAVLKKRFGLELWDYSKYPMNFQGRICLTYSIGFGFMSLVMLYAVQPRLEGLFMILPIWLDITVAALLALYFLSEFVPTIISAAKAAPALKRHAETIDDVLDEVEQRLGGLLENQHLKGAAGLAKKFILRFHRYNVRRLARISAPRTTRASKRS